MKKIYISGPMAGKKDFNKESFCSAEKILMENWVVFNPANLPAGKNITPAGHMDIDLAMIRNCDAIYMLKDWKKSKGANVEYHYAVYLNLGIMYEVI